MGLPETVLYSDFTETFRADGLFKAWLLLEGLLPRNHGPRFNTSTNTAALSNTGPAVTFFSTDPEQF